MSCQLTDLNRKRQSHNAIYCKRFRWNIDWKERSVSLQLSTSSNLNYSNPNTLWENLNFTVGGRG